MALAMRTIAFLTILLLLHALASAGEQVWTVYEQWPFDAEEAKRRQEETAKALGVPDEKSIDLGDGVKMDFVLIPAGTFVMGTPEPVEPDWAALDASILGGQVLLGVGVFALFGMLGTGESLIGVWSNPEGEELNLREDHRCTSHWTGDEDYFGTYEIVEQTISFQELRALVSVTGNAISFDVPYGVDHYGTYSLDPPDRWVFSDNDGTQALYERA